MNQEHSDMMLRKWKFISNIVFSAAFTHISSSNRWEIPSVHRKLSQCRNITWNNFSLFPWNPGIVVQCGVGVRVLIWISARHSSGVVEIQPVQKKFDEVFSNVTEIHLFKGVISYVEQPEVLAWRIWWFYFWQCFRQVRRWEPTPITWKGTRNHVFGTKM